MCVSVSSVDCGNTNISSMHLYPRRRNEAAQAAEELKTVTYAMEERRRKKNKKCFRMVNNLGQLLPLPRIGPKVDVVQLETRCVIHTNTVNSYIDMFQRPRFILANFGWDEPREYSRVPNMLLGQEHELVYSSVTSLSNRGQKQ